MAFRVRATGEYPVSKAALIAAHPSTSFPNSWDASVLDYLGVDEVVDTPRPVSTRFAEVTEGSPVFSGGTWTQVWNVTDIRDTMTAPQLAELLAVAKTEAKARVSEMRWQVENGGMDFNGIRIATDRASQSMLAGANLLATARPDLMIDWKTGSGWVQITGAELIGLSLLVGLHIQFCFTREKVLHADIDAASSFEELLEVEFTEGWPS